MPRMETVGQDPGMGGGGGFRKDVCLEQGHVGWLGLGKRSPPYRSYHPAHQTGEGKGLAPRHTRDSLCGIMSGLF